MNRFLLALSPLFLLVGCSVSADPQRGVEVIASYTLDNILQETSGLYCSDGSAFTINDSGNEPQLFTLNESGVLTDTVTLAATNLDWETITGNSEAFFIGDIGNNAGRRETLTVYKVSRANPDKVEKIDFTYAGNTPKENAPYAHDYDGEAMTMRDGKIVIFSKSWGTEQSHIYELSDSTDKQVLTPIANVDGLPGVVTGVDWSESRREFVLVGYRSNALGMFKPFIAKIDDSYQLKSLEFLPQFAQVEGVCFGTQDHILITQESSPYTSAKMAVLKFH